MAISADRSGEFVKVAVRDWGTGIPEEFHDRLFEKFSTIDATGSQAVLGTGLGLTISRAIIDHHQGKISFESKLGVGSTFYVELPITSGTG